MTRLVIEDSDLTVQIGALRRALGEVLGVSVPDGGRDPRA